MPRATKKTAPKEEAASADSYLEQLQDVKTKRDTVTKILDVISRWSIYILVFLIPFFFLPRIIDSLYLSKQFLATVLILISVMAIILKTLLKGEILPFIKAKFTPLLVLFTAGVALSAIFSGAKNLSFWGFGGSEPFTGLSVITVVLLFFLGLTLFTDKDFLKKTIFLFTLSGTVLFIFAILEAFLVGMIKIPVLVNIFSGTPWNPFGSANALSLFAAASLLFAVGVLFSKDNLGKGFKALLILQAVSAFIISLIISYRFSYLVLAIGTLFFIGFIFAKYKKNFIKKVNIPLLLFAVFLMLFVFNVSFARFFSFPTEVSPNISLSFKIGWESMQENIKNFLLGSGPSTFAYDFARYKPESLNQTGFWNIRFTSGFAAVPTLMAELGLLGLLSFGVFIFYYVFSLIKRLFNEKGEFANFFMGLLLAFLVFVISLFIYPLNFVSFFYVALILSLAIAIVGHSKKEIKIFSFDTLPHRALIGALSLIGALIGSAFLLFISLSHFVAEVNYTSGLRSLAAGERQEAAQNFAEAINWYQDDVYYRTLAITLVDDTLNKLNTGEFGEDDADMVRANFQNAIAFAKEATKINPLERENWFALGAVYERLLRFVNGADVAAIEAYVKVEDLEPSNPVAYLAQGRTYLSAYQIIKQSVDSAKNAQGGQGQRIDEEALEEAEQKMEEYLTKAEENLNKSLEKKRNLESTYILLSRIYEIKGETDKAIENLQTARIINPRNVDSLFNLGRLLYNKGEYQVAAEAMENILDVAPEYRNAMFIRGLSYDALDRDEEALQIFRDFAELDPENETVAQILENLEAGRDAVSGVDAEELESGEVPEAEPDLEDIEAEDLE